MSIPWLGSAEFSGQLSCVDRISRSAVSCIDRTGLSSTTFRRPTLSAWHRRNLGSRFGGKIRTLNGGGWWLFMGIRCLIGFGNLGTAATFCDMRG